MATLVIETATAACSVALIEGGTVLAAGHALVGRGHAERLLPMIRDCLADRPPPAAILVDCGPGSFTGVRVGVAAARALALGWSAEVHGFASLVLLAAMIEEHHLTVAITGGHGEMFVQRFAGGRPIDRLRSLSPEAAAATPDPLVVGSGAMALVAARGWGEARDLLPDAAEAWRLPPDLAALPPTPLYGRAPDAKLPA